MKEKKAEKKAKKRIEELNGGKTHPKEKESPGSGSEKLEKTKEAKEALPPFPPPPKGKESRFSPMSSDEEVEELDFEAIDIEEFSRDIINVPFEIWHIVNPGVDPLSEKEKKLIGKPLSRVIVKHQLQKYAKDEFVLVAFLSFAILGRLRKSKKKEPEKVIQ